jgi:hypothetical protein
MVRISRRAERACKVIVAFCVGVGLRDCVGLDMALQHGILCASLG